MLAAVLVGAAVVVVPRRPVLEPLGDRLCSLSVSGVVECGLGGARRRPPATTSEASTPGSAAAERLGCEKRPTGSSGARTRPHLRIRRWSSAASPGLPPYVFTIIDGLKVEARRAGRDVIDLGFGNPDIPSPEIAVEKLAEAAHNTRNHRYSASAGIPKLREAVADLYQRRFDVELDPDTEVISTIGAKEGFSHLMWVLLQAGDAALVPSPSYPIHIWGPYFAGADVRQVPDRRRRGLHPAT